MAGTPGPVDVVWGTQYPADVLWVAVYTLWAELSGVMGTERRGVEWDLDVGLSLRPQGMR